jgi:hypothetical protein
MKKITRRELLKKSAIAAIGGVLYTNLPINIYGQAENKSKVILIRNKKVLDEDGNANPSIVSEMLDEAIEILTDEKNIKKAWKKIIKPNDIVGIKTNEWRYLATPTELENAIKKRVIEVGVSGDKISIKDRAVLHDNVFKNATALINTRPMRTHDWSGVGSLLKNYIMFVNNPSAYHPDSCADLGAIWNLPIVKNKTRLNVLVMYTPLFHGVGPHHFNKKYLWKYYGLLVGFDPVAIDSIGVRIIQAKRKLYFGEDKPINPPTKHIMVADIKHKIGTADPNKINLIKVGWKEDILI